MDKNTDRSGHESRLYGSTGIIGLGIATTFLCVMTWLAYRPGLHGGWLYDDFSNIIGNASLRFHQITIPALWDAALSSDAGLFHRPLSILSFALQLHFDGLNPYPFKLVNLFLHLANGLLIMALCGALIKAYQHLHSELLQQHQKALLWLGVGAAWLLAPINLTSVLYVVQRETSLSSTFILIGTLLYTIIRTHLWQRGDHWKGGALLWSSIIAAGVLATLAKESGALLPLFCLCIEVSFFHFRNACGYRSRTIVSFFLVCLVLPLGAGLGWLASHGAFTAGYAARPFTLAQRIMTEPRIVFDYFIWTLGPQLRELGLFHDAIPLSITWVKPWETLPALLAIVALFALAWRNRYHRPFVALGLLWFLAGQSMESTMLPLILAFEHRAYLSSFGLFLALFAFILLEPGLARLRRPALLFLALFVAYTGWITAQRAWFWNNNVRLGIHLAQDHPKSERSAYMLARTLVNTALNGNHRAIKPAYAALLRSAALNQTSLSPYVGLLVLASRTGGVPEANWMHELTVRIHNHPLSPTDIQALRVLNHCLALRRCRWPRRWTAQLYDAGYASPYARQEGVEYANLLVLYANWIGYATPKHLSQAAGLVQQAANRFPSVAYLQKDRALVALKQGDIHTLKNALRHLMSLNHLGRLDLFIHDLKKAIRHLRKQSPDSNTDEPSAASKAIDGAVVLP